MLVSYSQSLPLLIFFSFLYFFLWPSIHVISYFKIKDELFFLPFFLLSTIYNVLFLLIFSQFVLFLNGRSFNIHVAKIYVIHIASKYLMFNNNFLFNIISLLMRTNV